MCWLCQESSHSWSDGGLRAEGVEFSAPGPNHAPSFGLDAIIQQLRTSWGGQWENDTYPLHNSTVYYALLENAPQDNSPENTGWQAMTGLMVQRAAEAFELWDDLVAITLNQYPGNPPANAQLIQFGYSSATDDGGTYEYAVSGSYLGASPYGGDNWGITRAEIWLNTEWDSHDFSSPLNQSGYGYYGGYGFSTYLHEIGHALGLSHPGSYNAGNGIITYQNSAEYAQDTRAYSIMSYFDADEDGSGTDHYGSTGWWRYAQTPLVHDIAAVQAIYGADTTTRAGNTTYGFNSTAGKDVFDFTKNTNPIVTLYDAGGIDTLDLSGFGGSQLINLTPGGFSNVGGYMTNNLSIAYSSTIENAIGGTGNDIFYGNAAANALSGNGGNDSIYGYGGNDTLSGGNGDDLLWGGTGNDTLDGGIGTDTASFSNALGSYTFALSGSSFLIGHATDGTDTVLDSVERLQFADMTITRTDLLTELASPPTFSNGDDTTSLSLFGGTANALDGNDTLRYRSGFATVDGGAGTDTIDFSLFNSAVWVYLIQSGAEAWTMDRSTLSGGTWRSIADLTSIENITGSLHSDQLAGNNGDNVLRYTGGYDQLDGVGGTDTIDFSLFGSAVWVDLASGAGTEAWTVDRANLIGGTWRTIAEIVNAENLIGTAGADELRGDNAANRIEGGGGDDLLRGRGGDDLIDGGDGTDTAAFAGMAGNYTFALNGSSILVGSASEGTDTVLDNVERFQFSDMTLTRAEILAELTPPTFTNGDDTATLPRLGGAFGGLDGNDTLRYRSGFATVDGGAGTDTIDFSLFGSAVWLYLNQTGAEGWTMDRSNLTGGTWRAIAELASIENITGSLYDDQIAGNSGDNVLRYTGGFDKLDGLGGTDTVDFSLFASAVWVDLTAGASAEAWTVDRATLTGGTWRTIADLTNAENLVGTAGADELRGDNAANRLEGRGGDDLLRGRGGDDLIDGGDGTDTAAFSGAAGSYSFALNGSSIVLTSASEGTDTVLDNVERFQFSDLTLTRAELLAELTPPTFTNGDDTATLPRLGGTFDALGGDDTLRYRSGFATVDGGAGSDTIDFSLFGSAVWVYLNQTGAEGWTMDRANLTGGTWRSIADLTNVEHITGSLYDDQIQGNSGDNVLRYTGGFDKLDGAGGSDTIDFSQFGSAVWVDLTSTGSSPEVWTMDRSTLTGGTWRSIGDLANAENLVGTAAADELRGDNAANRIEGGAGDDLLRGRGGDDHFVFRSGFGADRIEDFLAGAGSQDVLELSLGTAFDTFAEALGAASQVGADVRLDFGGLGAITLKNVTLASLHQDDFLFI